MEGIVKTVKREVVQVVEEQVVQLTITMEEGKVLYDLLNSMDYSCRSNEELGYWGNLAYKMANTMASLAVWKSSAKNKEGQKVVPILSGGFTQYRDSKPY